jgi:predicted transcriptional regulator
MSRLSYRERRMLLYHGMPAKIVAVAERMTIDEVLEVRLALRRRGVVPSVSEVAFASYDRMMRHNTAQARP